MLSDRHSSNSLISSGKYSVQRDKRAFIKGQETTLRYIYVYIVVNSYIDDYALFTNRGKYIFIYCKIHDYDDHHQIALSATPN